MIGVDTNVLVRFLVDDDPSQNRSARLFMNARTFEDPVFISAVTLAESVWVLERRLKFSQADVAAMLRALLASEAAVVEHGDELALILESELRTDLADFLIAWSGKGVGCTHTATFDRKAAKVVPSMELLS